MTVSRTHVESLLERADDGVALDGFRLERSEDGDGRYVLETPDQRRPSLDESALEGALESTAEYVTNWSYWQETVGGEGTARRAFLRWCERAPVGETEPTAAGNGDRGITERGTAETEPIRSLPERYDAIRTGISREWGQLSITVSFDDGDDRRGGRVYELRHVDDDGAQREDLEALDEPRDARDIATTDENGRYRPLKTAPTLESGWVFADLAGDDLVEAVDFLYPATIANWHRERRGNLDVDHWLETAERQTGIYDVVDELPREAVEWMAEACCVDSQCLRRREWEYEEDAELDVDGGDGQFPCREPCSLVIAAARKWTILESEDERTYELELTTSEFNQLTELIDAVAEGRTDEVREADVYDGANRYRARYLRAKRFDDGALTARSSDEE
ncbi:hypothetical protein EA462_09755 [Natrarchaeobius halalkaliphilus]|uniref:Uncharacterized protein n=1 Tax=Natrarchaeobius halalkaliphilus TaxID=1679091 RepID=A0A3N6P4E4_9EURY|nr:DR2241 family protein [Natrarchaeobius halalkaliphilus]RQG90255.1 hypothetical protein EA462_09755 [Natrarchaeobius halalkaliphilus]